MSVKGQLKIMCLVFFVMKGISLVAISDSLPSTDPVFCKGSFFDKVENSCAMNLRTDFSMYWGGNVVDNNFFGTIFRSEKITNDQKNRVLNRFKNDGRVGGGIKYNVSYYKNIGKDSTTKANGLGIYFSVQEAQQFDLKFSKELYSLVFYGNKQFKGNTVKFGELSATINKYQTFKFGIVKKAEKFVFAMGIGIVNGISNTKVRMSRADLYTAKDPKELKLDLNLDVMRSDTSPKVNLFNGQGVSADVYFSLNLSSVSSIRVVAEDFGFIHWNSQSIKANIEEKQFEFSGIYVNSLKDLSNSEIMYQYEDSLRKEYSVNYKKDNYSSIIPGKFMLTYRASLNNVGLEAGLFRYLTIGHLPHYFVGMDQTIQGFTWNANFGFGGYSNLSAGVGAGFVFGQRFGLKVSSSNLLGAVQPKRWAGNHYEIIMKYQFI